MPAGIGAGINLLLQIGDGEVSEAFTTIGGLRAKTVTLNAEEIDVTNHGSNQFKTLVSGAGTRSMAISGSGVFTDSATEGQLRTDLLAQTLRNFRIIDEATGDYWTGAFKITSLEEAGEYNGERTWSISLSSSGAFAFTAA